MIGGISGWITASEIGTWYATLQKPSFNPPNYLFGPVWTVLYLVMGGSFYLILVAPKNALRRNALVIFGTQLFLNFWWSIIFFAMHAVSIALIDIALLWVMIVWMIVLFRRVKPIAGYLQIPYLLWVSFATVLNAAILMLN